MVVRNTCLACFMQSEVIKREKQLAFVGQCGEDASSDELAIVRCIIWNMVVSKIRASSYSALGFWDQHLQLHYRPHVA
jgi:hypothetical protein